MLAQILALYLYPHQLQSTTTDLELVLSQILVLLDLTHQSNALTSQEIVFVQMQRLKCHRESLRQEYCRHFVLDQLDFRIEC